MSQFPSVRLPNPPRRVAGSAANASVWMSRLFILPHCIVGVGVVLFLLFSLLALLFGTDTPGVITGGSVHRGSKSTTYKINFRYTVDQVPYDDDQSTTSDVYSRFKDADTVDPASKAVTVRHFAIGPLRLASVPAYERTAFKWGFLILWSTFWNGIVGVFVYILWVKPWMLRRLYIHGEAVEGAIVSKRQGGRNSSTCYVSYRFRDMLSGQELTGECEATREKWDAAAPGDPVTVIYNPARPGRWNVAYGFLPGSLRLMEV